MSKLISQDNLSSILKTLIQQLTTNINNLDVSDDVKQKIATLSKIVVTGDGTKYLANDGTYKTVDVSFVNDIQAKIDIIYNLLNINGDSFTIQYPSIQAKLNALTLTGTGTTVLTDKGNYIAIDDAVLPTLTATDIQTLTTELNAL